MLSKDREGNNKDPIYLQCSHHQQHFLNFNIETTHWTWSTSALLTQQEWVQCQNWSLVRGGLGDDQIDQMSVKAGQREQCTGHYSSHGVTNKHNALRRGLKVLQDKKLVIHLRVCYFNFYCCFGNFFRSVPCLKQMDYVHIKCDWTGCLCNMNST